MSHAPFPIFVGFLRVIQLGLLLWATSWNSVRFVLLIPMCTDSFFMVNKRTK